MSPVKFPRAIRLSAWAIGAVALTAIGAADAQNLQKVRFGTAATSLTPLSTDNLIAEYLGYYKQEGLTMEQIPLGSATAVAAGLTNGRIEFGNGSAQLVLPLAARGEILPTINFFESHYPFRFGLGVKPGSPYKKYADLKGKTIGVQAFGVADYAMGKNVFKLAGIDPDKDINWLVVGEGVRAGIALQRGDIDADFTSDNGFSQIEAADIAIDQLPLPDGVPMVGGFYIVSTPQLLREHRAWAVGLARGVAKAHIFTRENPEAAAYIYGLIVPEALPKGKSLEEQVKAILHTVKFRMPFYEPYDKSVKPGFIKDSEWRDEVSFAGFDGKIANVSQFFTNDLIDEINNFDAEKIKAEARAFKLPYKK